MTAEHHRAVADYIANRRRERATLTLSDLDALMRVPENHERRAAIVAAINKLKIVDGADIGFAIRKIERWLYLLDGNNNTPTRQPTPAAAAEQLLTFAEALRKVRAAARDLNTLAVDYLNKAKAQHCCCSPDHLFPEAFGDFLDWGYPGLIESSEEAAQQLGKNKRRAPPAVEHNNLLVFATELAAIFELLTTRRPRPSGERTKFNSFVEDVLAAAPNIIDARSTRHLARKGAELICHERENNPT